MLKSEQIDQLASAMAKAQGEIKNARKSSDNPFFNSRYADLAEVLDTCRECLARNGIAVVQPVGAFDGNKVTVTTLLMHSSGQWISEETVMPVLPKVGYDKVTKEKVVEYNPQVTGSAITYARRYALAAMVGISQEDDDGNSSSGGNNNVAVAGGDPEPDNEGNGAPATTMACVNCGASMTPSVYRYSIERFKQPLCFKCQKNAPK